MKKITLFLIAIFTINQSYCQKYESYMLTSWEYNFNTKMAYNDVIISSNKITITDLFNGGKETLYMTIDSIVEKDYFGSPCKWYYCHSSDRKDIVIIPINNYRKKIYLFDFADDVTIFKYDFTFED
jgi:hypothetical protein